MSWGRIDDEAWHHAKFEALQSLGVDGMAAIGLWAMAISLTGQKKNPRLTLPQAVMLCGGCSDLASRCFNLLAKHCLLDEESCLETLPKQADIHDWSEYRSKDEAKVHAGRKGGLKSAEKRRRQLEAEAQAPPQAGPKHPPTPVPVPVPDPVPWCGGNQAGFIIDDADYDHTQVVEIVKRVAKLKRGSPGEARSALRRFGVVKGWELKDALDSNIWAWGGLISALERVRVQGEKPNLPPPKSKPKDKFNLSEDSWDTSPPDSPLPEM